MDPGEVLQWYYILIHLDCLQGNKQCPRFSSIIGEALTRLEKLDLTLAKQIPEYRQIIGFRNVLVHGYDAIEDDTVWLTIQKDIPILKEHVERLIAELEARPSED